MPEILNFGKVPKPEKNVLEITSFAGIDLSSAPSDVNKKRSPDAPNMMPDNKGNPIKRTGFIFLEKLGGRINGAYKLGEHFIVHAGESLYIDGNRCWNGMADDISSAQVLGDKLYIFDGLEALVCDGEDVWPIADEAYIPTVLISKNADNAERTIVLKGDGKTKEFSVEHELTEIVLVLSTGENKDAAISEGKIVFESAPAEDEEITVTAIFIQEPGGSKKEEFNLISSRWKESFLCDTGTEKNFTLSKTNLSKEKIKAWVMDEEGNWNEKFEEKDFSADRENGKITFFDAVSKTPVIGTDNLIIEAGKYFDGYEEKINRCKISIAYDTAGTANRIFLSGNPDEPRKDYWCASGNPEYWPDTYYSEIGSGESRVIGYSIIGDLLATFVSGSVDGRSVVIRSSELDEDGNVSFPVRNHLLGEEAITSRSFVFMEKEQLFLTERGVYAITTEDISGEKYTQNRSFYINKALCKEENLENAFCAKWKQFYVIAINGKLYLLDTSRKSYEKGEPLSAFQYECYLWTGINARVIWEEDGILFFGDENGRIFYFSKDDYSDRSDEGDRAIEAYWTFPDFMGDYFFRNKTVRMVAIQAAAYAQNVIRLEYRVGHIWKVLKEWRGKISFFDWKKVCFGDFSFSGDYTPRTVTLKTKIKKFDKCAFRLSCTDPDKAFGLYGFAVEYIENGRYKK